MIGLRNLANTARGKATPVQTLLATILGGMLGFVPDLGAAPVLVVGLLGVALLASCNLLLFSGTLVLAKLLSLPLLELSFATGQLLLDGPLGGLFAAMINAPVLAWCGLEFYANTGGLLLGGLLGGGLGLLQLCALRRLAAVSGTEGGQPTVLLRAAAWLSLGDGAGQGPAERLAAGRRGLPLRPLGLVAVLLLAGGLWAMQGLLTADVIRQGLVGQLESANGATVDLARVEVDLSAGKVRLHGLAMSDAAQLDEDLLRAEELEMDLGTSDLLAKRVVIDSLICSEAQSGVARKVPGKIIPGRAPVKEPGFESGEKDLEAYLAEFELWRARLRRWEGYIDGIFRGGPEDPDVGGAGRQPPGETEIEAARQRHALATVVARHLIQTSPRVLIRKLELLGVRVGAGSDEVYEVRGSNLASEPRLSPEPASLRVQRRGGKLDVALRTAAAARKIQLDFKQGALSLDRLLSGLKAKVPLSGGELDLDFGGSLDLSGDGVRLNLVVPLRIRNSKLVVGGKDYGIEDLSLPLSLRGPISAPRIKLESDALQKALVQAGKQELVGQLSKHLGGKVPVDVKKLVDDPAAALKTAAAKAAAEAKKKAEEEAKKAAAKGLESGLKRLFGGKKK